jgi:hypothetical protein
MEDRNIKTFTKEYALKMSEISKKSWAEREKAK